VTLEVQEIRLSGYKDRGAFKLKWGKEGIRQLSLHSMMLQAASIDSESTGGQSVERKIESVFFFGGKRLDVNVTASRDGNGNNRGNS
jgi:hypothetical protein